ncbi:MAG: helix-turn-helix transcriptional regulator [Bacteroidales bacterium]|nr:helix-turn-helix transcriptional regulator [Bacteroidales bacterium]
MNFYTALLLLPSVACFFWMIVHSWLASKVITFRVFIALLLTVGLVIITDDSDLLFAETPGASAISRLILQLTGPSVIPLLILYLDHVGRERKFHPNQMAWLLAPVILFAAAGVMTFMIGIPEVERFISHVRSAGHSVVHEQYAGTLLHAYYLSTKIALRATVFLELAIYLAFIVYLSKKRQLNYKRLFNKEEFPVLEAQVVCGTITLFVVMAGVISPGNIIMHSRHLGGIWALVSTASIFITCYFALFCGRKVVSVQNRRSGWRFNYSDKDKAALLEQIAGDLAEDADETTMARILARIGYVSDIDSLKAAGAQAEKHGLAESIFSAVSKSWDDPGLLSRFRHLMMDEQAFLEPGITVVDVAERLDSNKTYVSRMVNEACNLTFRELLNIMRIDYAEQYVMSHRDANQEEVARACGFLSASSFNTTFKRVTGYTPKVWAAREYELNPAS